MLLAPLGDRDLESVVRAVALPGEQVVVSNASVVPAALLGFPRGAVVWDRYDPAMRVFREIGVPTLDLSRTGWTERMAGASLEKRTQVLGGLLQTVASSGSWADKLFSELERAAGCGLPSAFRFFARRPLEYPRHHQFTGQLATCFGLTRGALKQRLARHGVPSPGSYLRWLRVFAAAHVLRPASVTTAQAAHRLGYTSSGSLCRAMQTLGGLQTAQLRRPEAWTGLLLRFTGGHLGPQQLAGWEGLQALFIDVA